MNKQEVTFKRKKIDKIILKMFTIEERLEYFDFLLSHFYKIYNHESNEDIKKFISDYNLKGGSYYNAEYLNNTWKNPVPIDDKMKNFKYFSPRFRKLLNEMLQLIIYVEAEKEKHKNAEDIINSDFLEILEIDTLLKKMNSFSNDKITFEWLNNYLDFIINLSSMPYRFFYDALYKKHNLEESYPMLIVDKAGSKPYYVPLICHLLATMIPFVIKQKKSYELKIKIADAKNSYPDKFVNNACKFPVFDFDYDRISSYSNCIFQTFEEKLEYFLYIVSVHDRMIGNNEIIPEGAGKCVTQLKKEIENYKEIFNLKLAVYKQEIKPVSVDTSKVTDTLDSIKNDLEEIGKKHEILSKDKRKSLLLKHYLDVAFQIKDIPRQSDLITKMFNKTYISRKFTNIKFLTELADFLKEEIDDRRYNVESIELIINCRNSLAPILMKGKNKKVLKDHLNSPKEPYNANDNNETNLFEGDEDMKYLTGEDGIMEE